MKLLREYTIIIDSREKHPLQFPDWLPVATEDTRKSTSVRLYVKRSKLDTGDYILQEAPLVGVVERKASLAELHGNLRTRDLKRFTSVLERLGKFHMPVILLEGQLASYTGAYSSELCPDPPLVLSHLNRLAFKHGVPVMYATGGGGKNTKKLVGEWVARYLIDASVAYEGTTA